MGLSDFKELISTCDMVLIGIGEEMKLLDSSIKGSKYYLNYLEKLKEVENPQEYQWVEELIKAYYSTKGLHQIENNQMIAYRNLYEMIKEKNYYIVTLNADSALEEIGYDMDKVVSPCGTYKRMQCEQGCSNQLWNADEILEHTMEQLKDPFIGLNSLEEPYCSHCGGKAVFNQVSNGAYIEDGYLKHWESYTKWLSQTLNRNLVILEIGVGFQYPSVIRWPFEKIVYYNQKASFIRASAKFPQLTQELENKSNVCSIEGNVVQFLLE